MSIVYTHTNIIADDWERLAAFYEQVFGCVRIPPERDLKGDWLARGTAVTKAHLRGVHLRLPGHGERGPTLEIFQYHQNEDKPPPAANRKGFGHLAFHCDDVRALQQAVVQAGGALLGEIVEREVPGAGWLTFCYVLDPERNILELQNWS